MEKKYNPAFVAAIREGYEVSDGALRKRIDEECDRYLESVGEPARYVLSDAEYAAADAEAKARPIRFSVRCSLEELARIKTALGPDADVAKGVVELALKAADDANKN